MSSSGDVSYNMEVSYDLTDIAIGSYDIKIRLKNAEGNYIGKDIIQTVEIDTVMGTNVLSSDVGFTNKGFTHTYADINLELNVNDISFASYDKLVLELSNNDVSYNYEFSKSVDGSNIVLDISNVVFGTYGVGIILKNSNDYYISNTYYSEIVVNKVDIGNLVLGTSSRVRAYNDAGLNNMEVTMDLSYGSYKVTYHLDNGSGQTYSFEFVETDVSSVKHLLEGVQSGTYTTKINLIDNETGYLLSNENTITLLADNKNSETVYNGNLYSKYLYFTDTYVKYKTELYLDVEDYTFATATLTLTGGSTYSVDVTQDSSYVSFILDNVAYGTYTASLVMKDVNGYYVTKPYSNQVTIEKPTQVKYHIITLDSANTIEGFACKLVFTKDLIELASINNISTRFYNNADNTELDYYIEKYDIFNEVIIWVKLPIGLSQIKMSHEIHNTSLSDGKKIFKVFDDFNSLDATLWTISGSNYTFENGKLKLTNKDTSIKFNNLIALGDNIEFKATVESVDSEGFTILDVSAGSEGFSITNASPSSSYVYNGNETNTDTYNGAVLNGKEVLYKILNSPTDAELALTSSLKPIYNSGLLFGIDDSGLGSVGTTITNWANVTGDTTYDFNTTAGSYPVVADYNGKKIARFTIDDLRTLNDGKAASYEYSVMMVARITPSQGLNRVLSTNTYNWLHGFHRDGFHGFHYGGWISSGEMPTFEDYNHRHEFHIFTSSVSKTANLTKLTRHGTIYNHSRNSQMPRDWVLGGRGQYNEQSNSDVACLYVWDRALNDTEISQFESVLASKYGIVEPYFTGASSSFDNVVTLKNYNTGNAIYSFGYNDFSSDIVLELNKNLSSSSSLNLAIDWLRILDDNSGLKTITVSSLQQTNGILTSITPITKYYTDSGAYIDLVLGVDTQKYEYDVLELEIVSTGMKYTHNGRDANVTFSLDNIAFGGIAVNVQLKTTEGYNVSHLEQYTVGVKEINEPYILNKEEPYSNYSVVSSNDNGNTINIVIDIDTTVISNLSLIKKVGYEADTDGIVKSGVVESGNISLVGSTLTVRVPDIAYGTTSVRLSLLDVNGYAISSKDSIKIVEVLGIVKDVLLDGKVYLSETLPESVETNVVKSSGAAKLNNSILIEELTILGDDGEPINIIKKIDNVYYLLQNVSWYEIQQVSLNSDYIMLNDDEVFNGNGFTIDLVTNSTRGLFKFNATSYGSAPIVKNLGILNGSLAVDGAGYFCQSSQKYFIIENCYSTGDIARNYCGGIIGYYNSNTTGKYMIKNCYSTGNIKGSYSGGIAGSYNSGNTNDYSIIDSCYSTGNIESTYCGGIVGTNTNYIIVRNCMYLGTNPIINSYSGGILGQNNLYCVLQNCYNKVGSTASSTGGILGRDNHYTIIQNCYNASEQYNGGLIGTDNDNVKVENSLSFITPTSGSGTIAADGCYGLEIYNTYSLIANVNSSQTLFSNQAYVNSNKLLDILNGNYSIINNTQTNVISNSYISNITCDNGFVLNGSEYPLIKTFTEKPWNKAVYTKHDSVPDLYSASIIGKQTNYRIGGCDLKFDLVFPDTKYSEVTRIEIEALGTDLKNSYNVRLSSQNTTVLLKNTEYTDYNIRIKVYNANGNFVIPPHDLYIVSIKPDGLKVTSLNKIISEGDKSKLSFALESTNPSGMTLGFELMKGDNLYSKPFSYDGSYGRIEFTGSEINYTPNGLPGRELIYYISREKETNIPSIPGVIDVYIDAAPEGKDTYVNLNSGETVSITLEVGDPQEGTFTTELVSDPTKGSIVKVNELTYTYTSNGTDYGEDIIKYVVKDNYNTSKIYGMYMQINSTTNTLSQALNGSYTCERNQTIDIQLLSTDANADRARFKITQMPRGKLSATKGVMRMDIRRNYVGSIEYKAAQDFTGVDEFKFVVDDGIVKSEEGTISITCINSIPIALDIGITTIDGRSREFLLRGVDLNNDNLIYAVSDPLHGVLTNINGNRITYKPNDGYSGADSFTYTVSDGYSTSNIGTVSIDVELTEQKEIEIDIEIDDKLHGLPITKRNKIKDDIKVKVMKVETVDDLLVNYTKMIYDYRKGNKVKVSEESLEEIDVTSLVKKTLRKELRRQMNSLGYSSFAINSTVEKNNILRAANSVANVNPYVFQKNILSLIPPADISDNNIPVYNLNELSLETNNAYFDITKDESIKLTYGDSVVLFTYVVETDDNDEIVDDYLEDEAGNIYRAGDNITIDGNTVFIMALGSVLVSNGSSAASSGDPYITTLTNKTYKMRETPGIYRMFEGDDIVINAEVDWISMEHKDKILNYFSDMGLTNVVTRGILYKYLYIENEGERLVVDFTTRKIHTNKDFRTINLGVPYESSSASQFYKSIKCIKTPIIITNSKHGKIKLEVELYENPQIDSGLSISVQRYSLSDVTGLMVDTYKEMDMKVSKLNDLRTLRNKEHKREHKRNIIEKHEAWYYFK